MDAKFSLYKLIHDQGGKIVSTSTLSLDNVDAVKFFIYVQAGKDMYRCIELKDFSFTTVKSYCEILIPPEKEMTYLHGADVK